MIWKNLCRIHMWKRKNIILFLKNWTNSKIEPKWTKNWPTHCQFVIFPPTTQSFILVWFSVLTRVRIDRIACEILSLKIENSMNDWCNKKTSNHISMVSILVSNIENAISLFHFPFAGGNGNWVVSFARQRRTKDDPINFIVR